MLAEAIEHKIREIIHETVPGVFVIELALHRSKRSVLTIEVDTDAGITLSECTSISRRTAHYLDENDVFGFPYTLEVSSPGVGKPLKLPRQYLQNIGRTVKVNLKDGTEAEGKLLEADEKGIWINKIPVTVKKKTKGARVTVAETEKVYIDFFNIKDTRVIISFG